MDAFTPTPRTAVKRLPKRGVYDRSAVHAILDEGFICHAAFIADGSPVVIPTAYGRDGDRLYLHGSAASRMLKTMATEVEVCVAVTLVDALVLARSAFHHSMNYRSVVVFGNARSVLDPSEKATALRCITEHIARGRWSEVRPPTEQELKATLVLALPLEEVSAKVRSGPPIDDAEDYDLPVWAGILPLALIPGDPTGDGRNPKGVPIPPSVSGWKRYR